MITHPRDPIGRVAQLVRAPASHAGGPGFESLRAHHSFNNLHAYTFGQHTACDALCDVTTFRPESRASRAFCFDSIRTWL